MTERPILFSAPMVRAILAGTKTQTRRVLKQATGPSLSVGIDDEVPGVAELSWLYGDGPGYDVHEAIKRVPCPYGKPGDRLWVREAHSILTTDPHGEMQIVSYRATDDECNGPWKPSIHMPRWASRITLEVTDVRVERLKDISEADAAAEGVIFNGHHRSNPWSSDGLRHWLTARDAYADLWRDINGEDSWDANPWVWVVEFKRVTG